MNYLQLTQRLRREAGVPGNGPLVVTGQSLEYQRLLDWIAQAYLEICNKWQDWNFLWDEDSIELESTEPNYDLPADFNLLQQGAVYIRETPIRKLEVIKYSDYRAQKELYTEMSGDINFVTLTPAGQLKTIPTPAAADDGKFIDFEYGKLVAPLTAATDEPVWHADFHMVIVWRALMLFCGSEEDTVLYQTAAANYAADLLRLEARYLPNRDQLHGRSEGAQIVVRAE